MVTIKITIIIVEVLPMLDVMMLLLAQMLLKVTLVRLRCRFVLHRFDGEHVREAHGDRTTLDHCTRGPPMMRENLASGSAKEPFVPKMVSHIIDGIMGLKRRATLLTACQMRPPPGREG